MGAPWYGDGYPPFDGRVDPIQRGSVSVSLSAAATGSTAVTFDYPFVNTPIVVCQVIGNANYFATTGAPTTTGCNPGVSHRAGTTATTTLTVHWVAMEP